MLNAPVANIPSPITAMNPGPAKDPALPRLPAIATAINVAAATPRSAVPPLIKDREFPFRV